MKNFLVCLLIFACLSRAALAADTSMGKPNNKIGIHLAVASDEDLAAAAKLVNGNGGDWGYVTVVIQDNDLDTNKWQGVFNKMRGLHLIPLVRLATHPEGENWTRPTNEIIPTWVNFLNSLNWVVRERYVILFNETNHAAEWGGEVDPVSFAKISLSLAKALRQSNPDYFLMLGGVDQATPQALPQYAAAVPYLEDVIGTIGVENFEKYFQGWSSHSYPNPGFVGSPYGTGMGSVRGYEAELALLSDLGIEKELPIFITETGWKRGSLSEQTVADYLLSAYQNVWLPDERIRAVTPFVLNYQGEPFLDFSWQHLGESSYYLQFAAVERMDKTKGQPAQKIKVIFQNQMPGELVEDSSFHFQLKLQNQGQAIWDKKDGYELKVVSNDNYFYKFAPLNQVEPGQEVAVDFEFHTPNAIGESHLKIGLFQNGESKFLSQSIPIKIIPLQNITLKYQLFNLGNTGTNFQAELYDQYENLVYVGSGLKGKKGTITLKKVRNVAVGERYRVVLLKPYYLPRQKYLVLKRENNLVKFAPHLPLDWNNDGQWTVKDLWPFN